MSSGGQVSMQSQSPSGLRFVIVGGGMAGILVAIRLREAGYTNFTLYEKADSLGGAWRDNTYPGVACDVPAHLYSYSFAPNPDFSRLFAPGSEIRAYFEHTARERGVLPHVRFGQEIVRCAHEGGHWQLETARGDRDHADFVLMATGVLHQPNVPELPGLANFASARFHSARWDHAVPLDRKRVGVIGTGSTAVQIVSALADRVAKLALFQRTAQWIMPQENPEYSATDRAEFRQRPEVLQHVRHKQARLFTEVSNAVIDVESTQLQTIEQACLTNLEKSVRDAELRERLRPDYRAACKRLVISGDFYRAIQAPSAELVTDAIERIEPEGVRTRDGRLHALDVLVLATGFRADRFMRPMRVFGRDGLSLDALWAQRPLAYQTVSVPGFPNLFMLNGPNSPIGNFSLVEAAEVQLGYILQLIERVRAGECREINATQAATERFELERVAAAKRTVWSSGCKSWYLDDRGVPTAWPWSFAHFRERLAQPVSADFELS